MGIEIERKFLVNPEKWGALKKPSGTHYHQGYLLDDVNCTIRVRLAGKVGFITIKGPNLGITRKEFEYKIPAAEASELIGGFAKSAVEKVRYKIKFAGKLWEVDEFLGDNEGLLMAEIELKDEHEVFEKPAWITAEVSGDVRYYNSNLANNPFKNWRKK
ncbi:MAG TPA: CYTH domain-containing protein [Mucilaginibacter sp.]|jgi:CYTH domain-containing protein|nr:CYTH domain-containing protein [Mucilaginibacter sp.]